MGDVSPVYNTFAGQPVDANSILVKLTLNGDADLNGKLDGSDYFFIDKGYLARNLPTAPSGYRNGDFDYNGQIDASDYFLIDKAFLASRTAATAQPATLAAAPQPPHRSVLLRQRKLKRKLLGGRLASHSGLL